LFAVPLVLSLAIAWLRVCEAGADRLTAVLVLLTHLLLWPRAVLALALALALTLALALASGQAVFVEEVTRMTVEGELRSVIERVYRLEEIIEAHAHVDSGRKKGTVIVKIGSAR
jgi:NADPH:quinone reductase-like Zn-dependent oxidoreductase